MVSNSLFTLTQWKMYNIIEVPTINARMCADRNTNISLHYSLIFSHSYYDFNANCKMSYKHALFSIFACMVPLISEGKKIDEYT